MGQKGMIGRVAGSSQIDGMTRGQGLEREVECAEDAAMASGLGHWILPPWPPKQVPKNPVSS